MNVCIIGEGLTALSLAKSLINKKIYVHYYHKGKNSNFSSNRTIGISKSNFEFFKEKIFFEYYKNLYAEKKYFLQLDDILSKQD